jgi:hypothetical protein
MSRKKEDILRVLSKLTIADTSIKFIPKNA